MSTVTIRVASLDDVKKSTLAALRGDVSTCGEFITFLTFEELHRTLTPWKMQILDAMTGAGELTFRAIAERVGRDVKAVHTAITALMKCGIVEKTESGCLFPYDGIRFDFTLRHPA